MDSAFFSGTWIGPLHRLFNAGDITKSVKTGHRQPRDLAIVVVAAAGQGPPERSVAHLGHGYHREQANLHVDAAAVFKPFTANALLHLLVAGSIAHHRLLHVALQARSGRQ